MRTPSTPVAGAGPSQHQLTPPGCGRDLPTDKPRGADDRSPAHLDAASVRPPHGGRLVSTGTERTADPAELTRIEDELRAAAADKDEFLAARDRALAEAEPRGSAWTSSWRRARSWGRRSTSNRPWSGGPPGRVRDRRRVPDRRAGPGRRGPAGGRGPRRPHAAAHGRHPPGPIRSRPHRAPLEHRGHADRPAPVRLVRRGGAPGRHPRRRALPPGHRARLPVLHVPPPAGPGSDPGGHHAGVHVHRPPVRPGRGGAGRGPGPAGGPRRRQRPAVRGPDPAGPGPPGQPPAPRAPHRPWVRGCGPVPRGRRGQRGGGRLLRPVRAGCGSPTAGPA